ENNKKILENKFYNLKNEIDIEKEVNIMEISKSFCKVCGKELNNNSEYCEYCSANLGEDESFERLRAHIKKLYKEQQKS
ncbi:MAG: hypothetical protein ACFFA6_17645, partial [Promethearchaeota archaeon]